MITTLDLNCDLGELLPGHSVNYDAEIMPYLSSCNIACGFHSGDPFLMEQTIRLALKHGVAIGAHPSYDDRTNFGRVSVAVDIPVLQAQLRYQISAIKGMVESWGGRLHHVKPHGALYNDMVKNEELTRAVVAVIYAIDPDLVVLGMSASLVAEYCERRNIKFVHEVFADRKYQNKTQLRSRQFEDAVLSDTDEVMAQVDLFLQGMVKDAEGNFHRLPVESICLHSDTQGAVDLAKAIHESLVKKHVNINPIL